MRFRTMALPMTTVMMLVTFYYVGLSIGYNAFSFLVCATLLASYTAFEGLKTAFNRSVKTKIPTISLTSKESTKHGA
ncbi:MULTISPECIES: hypothetical protein [Vibrio]|uniref:Uncharacterized protein n=1 Tax=bacterium 19MO03SA05 TaxID=2920620 RepID=A0AAU6VLR9_UNCXX|nr:MULTISPECIES: hypothetical protein [Vibrio]EKO3570852.1 hypothetical protein [Vibrio metschnikovii]EKO3581512.1 hypothetical protein [Vibrio metschnikovii]EKO3589843.1 hypothetical protein [Vibrio metschnikovii]EKO3605613.1 hypothetical protein [Vibrio metschnikovii]EKO3627499.1 hypothetical protein [Vibrio metschnikovii]